MTEGTVRWFDTDRGFGFIALGQEAEDLFVHASEIISDDATKVLREGQVVEFEIGEGDRGPQARRVRVTGDQAADAPLGVLGTVAWYEPAKGYGFVTPDGGGAEIFVHSSAIVGGGVVSEGQRVAFLVVEGEKGPQAEHLLPLGAQADPAGRRRPTARTAPCPGTTATRASGSSPPSRAAPTSSSTSGRWPAGSPSCAEGDRVTYDVAVSEKGPQARDVHLARGSAPRGSGSRRTRRAGRPGRSAPGRRPASRARRRGRGRALRRGPGLRLHRPRTREARTCSCTCRSSRAPSRWRRVTGSGTRCVRATEDRRPTASSASERAGGPGGGLSGAAAQAVASRTASASAVPAVRPGADWNVQ